MKAKEYLGKLANMLLEGIKILFFAWIKKREKKI